LLVTNQGAMARDGYGVAVSTAPTVGAAFTRPTSADDVLSPPVFFSNAPRPALDARGGGLVSWYQSLGGPLRVLVSSRADAGSAFAHVTETSAISPDGGAVDSAAPPDPATSSDGSSVVAWGQEDGRGGIGVYFARRVSGGALEIPSGLDDRLSIGDGT